MGYNPETFDGQTITALTDVVTQGGPALTDVDVLNRGGVDYKVTLASRSAMFRATPAGSRSVALPAILTAADHDKNVLLTGTSGALSTDGTLTDGFRCQVINTATGLATYSGITGLLNTSSLASGAACSVLKVGSTIYATAAPGSSGAATTYSQSESVAFGLSGTAVTVTYSPTSGTWPSGITLTPAASGVAGTWSPASTSPTANSTAAVSVNWTPSATGTATLSVTNSGTLTNPSGLTYTVNATATAYTTGLSATTGTALVAMTMTFTPTSGGWPTSEVITPTVSGVTGTFSPTTVSTTAGSTAAVTCTFTPSNTGTASLSSTTSPAMTNTTGAQNYVVTAQAATGYTTTLSAASGAVGTGVTTTFLPNGTWPAGEAITLTNAGLSGTWSGASGGTLSGSVLSPSAGIAACSAVFTPSSAASGTISATTAPSLTSISGAQNYQAFAVATAFTTSPTSVTVANGQATTLTHTPTGGVWGSGETIGLALVTVAGAFSGTTNGTISGSGPYVITPTVGNSTPVTVAFTPSSANGTSGSITVSGTGITATNTSVSVTVGSSVPSFPSLPSTGLHSSTILVEARWMANAGVTSSSGNITAIADQTGNGHDLAATVGVTVGANTGGNVLPSVAFSSTQATSANSGLTSYLNPTNGWLADAFSTVNWTVFLAFQTGSSLTTAADEYVYMTASNTLQHHWLSINHGNNHLFWRDYGINGSTIFDLGALATNTLYRVIIRMDWQSGQNTIEKVWVNATPTTIVNGAVGAGWANERSIVFGQGMNDGTITAWGNTGCSALRWLESGVIKGSVPDANITGAGSIDEYLTNKWS